MRFEFKLPDIGEGMVEGEIAQWHVRVGNEIQEDAPVLDIMTDKATVTISSPKKGKVLELCAKEGEIRKVGSVLFVLETAESISREKPEPPATNARGHSTGDPKTKIERSSPVDSNQTSEKVLASPATRRLAHELGVDLSRVRGTGPGARITHDDVRASLNRPTSEKVSIAVSSKTNPVSVNVSDGTAEERIPFRGLRRKIAEKMVISKAKIPHFTYVEEADASQLVALREKVEAKVSSKQIRVTYLPFVIKAVIAGLKKYPNLNSVLDEERQEIIVKHFYNIGIGVATPEGLTVPVIKNADQKDLYKLAQEIQELSEKARANKLLPEDLHGSTFTITSLGALGGMFATPIINYPEVAILGLHRIEKRPVVRDNQIVIRDMMYVSLSFDHRVIDGDVGARFANEVIEQLQHIKSTMSS